MDLPRLQLSRLLMEQEQDRLFGSSATSTSTSTRGMAGPRRRMNEKNNRNEVDEDKEEENDNEEEEEEEEVEQPVEEEQAKETEEEETTATEEETQPEEQTLVGETRIDLVKLVPFDVKLTMLATADDRLNTFALTDIVTEWMDESLAAEVKRMELGLTHSAFDSVILEERGLTQHSAQVTSQTSALSVVDQNNRRKLQAGNTIASYEGVTLWKHTVDSDLEIMTPALLEDLERQALLHDDKLLELLQASDADGLGSQVQAAKAYINPNPPPLTPTTETTVSTTNSNLELIIVVAIVVACMAFCFLVFSLFWAWRLSFVQRQTYRIDSTPKNKRTSAQGTDDSEEERSRTSPSNMNVVVNTAAQDDDTALEYPASETNPTTGLYPESVISEDISTSLSAYYRSGMGSRPLYGSRALGTNDFNDQASFSSMESYGYSLDGYAPSLGGNTLKNETSAAKAASEAGEDVSTTNP